MTANMKKVKLTEQELLMLNEACREFTLGLGYGWETLGYTSKEIKAYYNAQKKLFGTKPPKIEEER